MGDERIPEDPAHHGGVLGRPLLGRREPVETGRQDRVDRPRDLDVLDRPGQLPVAVPEPQDATVDEHPHELLGEERIPVGERDHPVAELGRQAAGEQGVDQLGALPGLERLEHDRGGIGNAAAPRQARLDELVAGQAEQDDRPVAPSAPCTR